MPHRVGQRQSLSQNLEKVLGPPSLVERRRGDIVAGRLWEAQGVRVVDCRLCGCEEMRCYCYSTFNAITNYKIGSIFYMVLFE